jgi:hypothetical protein
MLLRHALLAAMITTVAATCQRPDNPADDAQRAAPATAPKEPMCHRQGHAGHRMRPTRAS